MGLLSQHINGVMDATKFWEVNSKYGSRVIHQPVSHCPNGMKDGCKICVGDGRRRGYHPRKILETNVHFFAYRRQDGKPDLLTHRFPTTPVTITCAAGVLNPSDFSIAGRIIIFHTSQLALGERYEVQYTAYVEDSVHMQHAMADFAGANRKAEHASNLRFGGLDQGQIAMSLPANAQGYECKEGDRFFSADALMQFELSVDPGTLSPETDGSYRITSRHQFVNGQIVESYALNQHDREVDMPVTFDADTKEFVLQTLPPGKGVIVYNATPIYTVWLDQGEFRTTGSQDHQRLVLLVREEISR